MYPYVIYDANGFQGAGCPNQIRNSITVNSATAGAFAGVTSGSNFTATLDLDPLDADPLNTSWFDGTNFFVNINGTVIDENALPLTPSIVDFFNAVQINPPINEHLVATHQ